MHDLPAESLLTGALMRLLTAFGSRVATQPCMPPLRLCPSQLSSWLPVQLEAFPLWLWNYLAGYLPGWTPFLCV